MPKGTKVDRCYQGLKGKRGKARAAAICQASTGQALATGKPPKSRSRGSSRRRLEGKRL